MKQQSGFTLIELIAVIVILGIIAAVAVPRFVDLSDAAEEAAVNGVAGNLASASALNYANYVATQADLDTNAAPQPFTECTATAAGGLLQGGLPDGYTIAEETGAGTDPDAGAVLVCSVTRGDYSADFNGYYVPGSGT